MSTGAWGDALFIAAATAAIFWLWIITKPESEDPPGVTIMIQHQPGRRRIKSRWHYIADDQRALRSTGYITRASAIRAANTELNRLNAKDTAQ